MRPGSRAWAPYDDTLLLTLVRRRASVETMANLLGRTKRAVYNRLNQRRLIRRPTKRSGDPAQVRMDLRRLGIAREQGTDERGRFTRAVLTTR